MQKQKDLLPENFDLEKVLLEELNKIKKGGKKREFLNDVARLYKGQVRRCFERLEKLGEIVKQKGRYYTKENVPSRKISPVIPIFDIIKNAHPIFLGDIFVKLSDMENANISNAISFLVEVGAVHCCINGTLNLNGTNNHLESSEIYDFECDLCTFRISSKKKSLPINQKVDDDELPTQRNHANIAPVCHHHHPFAHVMQDCRGGNVYSECGHLVANGANIAPVCHHHHPFAHVMQGCRGGNVYSECGHLIGNGNSSCDKKSGHYRTISIEAFENENKEMKENDYVEKDSGKKKNSSCDKKSGHYRTISIEALENENKEMKENDYVEKDSGKENRMSVDLSKEKEEMKDFNNHDMDETVEENDEGCSAVFFRCFK